MRSICCKVFNETFLLLIVEWEVFLANCELRSFCCELWNENFLLRIVEWKVFVANSFFSFPKLSPFLGQTKNEGKHPRLKSPKPSNNKLKKTIKKIIIPQCCRGRGPISQYGSTHKICSLAGGPAKAVTVPKKTLTLPARRANCGMRNFCRRLWNEKFLLESVWWDIFAANCGMGNFCCGLWNEKIFLPIVDWQIFVTNCGMRSFCCEFWNENFLLWIVKWEILLQIVEW